MRPRLLVATVTIGMALTACGGGDGGGGDTSSSAPEAAGGEVAFLGADNLQWAEDTKQATLQDDALDLSIQCEGGVGHNVVLEGVRDDEVLAECEAGATGTGTVELEPGTYTYYCNIVGHRNAGMEGQLTVS